jgi:hypothetical protein
MAFTTTQRVDNAMLRGLSFRTPLNLPISSQYTLYANGQGQTYWSNSVSPTDLSTVYSSLSTSIRNVELSTQSSVIGLQNSIQFLSTYNVSFLSSYTSTLNQLLLNDSNLSNSVLSLSNNLTLLAYSNAIQINNIYNSTLQEVNTILNNYSNLSTFYLEQSSLVGVINSAASSLSTTIGVQNTSTYNVLTSNYTLYVDTRFINLNVYLSSAFSTVYSTLETQYSTAIYFSTAAVQLLSSTSSITSTLFGFSTIYGGSFSTLYDSTITNIQSTAIGHETRISSLEAVSTALSSVTYVWISTFVSTSQGYQDIGIQSSVSSLSYQVSSLRNSTIQYYDEFKLYSSYAISTYTNNSTTISTLQSQVSSLLFEYSVLTTSSILGGIYSSFVQLEVYTYGLVASTYSTNISFQSSLYSTSISTISSIANAYFNYFVSTMYDSTLSTLVPSTQQYMSSLYSTTLFVSLSSATVIVSSIASTTTTSFLSTTSSLTNSILASTTDLLNSSITGNLILPTQSTNAAYSTLFFSTLSTMTSTGYGQIGTQSTMFSSLYVFYSTVFSTLYTSSLNQVQFISTQTGLITSSANTQLSTNSTLFGRQLSTQNQQFNSSITSWSAQLNIAATSTTNAIFVQTTAAANTTLNNIQTSTTNTYNTFVTGLTNSLPTSIWASSLYTEQVLNLTSTTSTAIMDLASFRNFNINVFNILNNPNTSYRLTYNQNSILNLSYRTGFIFINVSTIGQSYINNNSQLRFDAYQWGIPTTVFGNVYPYISSADYTLQYQYVIQNNVLFTNLMNVYPRVRILTTAFSIPSFNVFTSNVPVTNAVWRGTPINVAWTKYSFFSTTLGSPPFNPNIVIDMIVNNTIVAEYGPYPFESTSATVNAPYLRGVQSSNVLPTTLRVYIAGAPTTAATSTFLTLMPTFDTFTFSPRQIPTASYLGGSEFVGITDTGTYPLHNTPIILNNVGSNISYDNTSNFIPQNLVNGILNRVGSVGATPTNLTFNNNVTSLGNFTEASASIGSTLFWVNLGNNSFNEISTIQNFGSRFTFTFSSPTTQYSFEASSIRLSTGTTTIWRIDGGFAKPTNTFTSGNAVLTYSYTNVNAISSSGYYTESTFCGPTSNTPLAAATADLNSVSLSASLLPMSTLLFYNLLGNPLAGSNTTSMTIRGTVNTGATVYQSTFITSGASNVQIFRI